MNLPAFYDRAECAGMDTQRFFPLSPRSRPSPLAVKACSRCEVREECLSFSLRPPMQLGYWGGMTEEQRLAERKRRHIQQATDRRRAALAEQRANHHREGAGSAAA